jgi:hypothetical protein
MNPRAVRTASVLLGLFVLLGLASTSSALAARGDAAAFWLPRPASPERLSPVPETYFEGLSGFVVGVAPEDTPALAASGGRALSLAPGETLYAFLLQDAELAAFESPTRVLVRVGHEVFLATAGDVPRLTAESDRALTGLKQPVRIDLVPRPSPTSRAGRFELPAPSRDVDPFVQGMVSEVSTATYVPIWQALDDFETREAFQPNNVASSQWMLDKFQSYGLSAAFHYYTHSGQKRNVVATMPGQVDPTKVVYICGHFDSTSPTPATCAPGADDNATGTAAVIEAARILSQYLFEYTIKFACWNSEEQGLVGSAAYAAEMAAAGEDIIAVYNCDMIGYRGTDPAPADLVIYTNTASQSVATILANAVTTYVPGQIEPIVVVESLTGSDHASFWNHNYKAVCAIEDEAWGSDFCPWYHTCNDRIEQYPQDYVISCTKANLAAVALTALPINPQSSYLVLGSSTLDDDTAGGSSGNGDGVANPGETIELWATVRNVGAQTATGVTGTLTTTTPGITILNATAPWADIPAGGQGTNVAALRFQVAATVTDGTMLNFTLSMTDAGDTRLLPLQYTAAAPRLAHYWHQVVDLATGNGNGVVDPGEAILVPVTISNRGSQGAEAVTALAASGSAHLTVMDGTATTASIPSGSSSELAPGFRLAVSLDATPGELLVVSLTISTVGGYQVSSNFKLKVGSAVYDECESEGPWSLASPGDNATSGLWVRGDPVGTTYNSQQCQPEDDHTAAPGTDCYVTGQGVVGGAAGAEDVDGGKTTLTTPLLDLSHIADARVTYWRWYTNNLGNSPNLDPWIVQISGDDGTSWVDLENTTVSANSWTEKSFLVSSFIMPTSQVRVRFIANDIAPNSLIEAAVDDFEVSGTSTPVGVGDEPLVAVLRLDAPRPNPFLAGTRLRFALPEAGPVSLQIFGIEGRLVRTLVRGTRPAGEHEVVWDGRNGYGRTAAPGIYFCRLMAGGHVLSQRMVVAP